MLLPHYSFHYRTSLDLHRRIDIVRSHFDASIELMAVGQLPWEIHSCNRSTAGLRVVKEKVLRSGSSWQIQVKGIRLRSQSGTRQSIPPLGGSKNSSNLAGLVQ